MPEREEPLAGGNISTVVRVGDTVRRTAGPWTEGVHALLRHVRARGFDLAPEPLGLDERGREVLRFMAGETVGEDRPWPGWAWDERTLADAGSALRRFHDAVADFRPTGPIHSRLGGSTLGEGEIVCHNDFAPYNAVYDGRLSGVIDWDIIAAAKPTWDLAFVAWQWVPLHNERLSQELGAPPISDRIRRLALLCEAYGGPSLDNFTDEILRRVRASSDGILERASVGDPAFVRLRNDGHAQAIESTYRWIRKHESELAAAVR